MTDRTSDLPKLAPETPRVRSRKNGETKNAIRKEPIRETSSLLLDVPMNSFDDNTDKTSVKIATHVGMNNRNDFFYDLLSNLRELEGKKDQTITSKTPDLTADLDTETIQIGQDRRSIKLLLRACFDGFDRELVPYSRVVLTKPIQTPHVSTSL